MPNHTLIEIAPDLTDAELDYIRALYDSEIALSDEHIGRFLRRLRELDLYDDSLIVITGDHGEEFLERSTIGHGNHLHAESIRVPLIVKPPGWKQGRVVRTPVSLIDVGRTVCALSGVEWPIDTLGRGRTLPLLDAKSEEGHAVISELEKARSIIVGRWKLLTADWLGDARLYDSIADPGERHDVISSHPEIAERLSLQLETWAETLRAESDGIPFEFSDEEIQRLRALGYVQ
jgi:arylsulfatase A-like enzyme